MSAGTGDRCRPTRPCLAFALQTVCVRFGSPPTPNLYRWVRWLPDTNGWKETKTHTLPEDDERLDVLYRSYRSAIDAYCRRRVPADAVSDLVSEVFLAAWRRIADIPREAELPWLYGVARNVVSNHQRGTRRRLRLVNALTAQPRRSHDDAEVQVVRRSEEKLLLEALTTLSPMDQEVLRLRAWEELSSAEIATVLSLSPGAVDMRLTRAKRRLRKALKSAGYFEPVSSPRIVRNGGTRES